MTEDSHRARLSIELEESDRVGCRFLSPEQSKEEICAYSTFDAQSRKICTDYDNDVEFLPEGGIPTSLWLSEHREKRRLAVQALSRIGLPGTIGQQLHQLRSQIGNGMLLLELSIKSPQLDSLPWELLGSADAESHYDSNLVVWRFMRLRRVQPWPQSRLLLVSASPPEQRISPNVDKEFSDIRGQVERSDRKDAQIEDIMHSSALQFAAKIFQVRPNVLHMAMHGDRKFVYFEREVPREQDSSEEPLTDQFSRQQREVAHDRLVADIAEISTVLTTILSVCYSANRDGQDTSFARKLIEAGIPSAIGMAYSVTPEVSEEFCHVFYREICKGEPVADAYGSAIIALRKMPSYHECLWSVPMLYASDNVIPLPNDNHKRFLGNVRTSVNRVEELRRNVAQLSLQLGTRPGNWSVDSTRTAMGLGKVRSGLRYLRDNSTATRAESYLWRLEFGVAYNELGRKLDEANECLAQLSRATGSAAQSRSSQRFSSVAPSLISELDNIRRLILDEFPAISDVA